MPSRLMSAVFTLIMPSASIYFKSGSDWPDSCDMTGGVNVNIAASIGVVYPASAHTVTKKSQFPRARSVIVMKRSPV